MNASPSPDFDDEHPIGVAVLGSTGSVGTRTLDVIAHHPERFRVVALAAGRNHALLDEQVHRFRPAVVSCEGEAIQSADWTGTRVVPLDELVAQPEVELVVAGIV